MLCDNCNRADLCMDTVPASSVPDNSLNSSWIIQQQIDSIAFDEWKLLIRSFYVEIDSPYMYFDNRCVLEQELYFYEKDNFHSRNIHPVWLTEIEISDGKKLIVLENVITSINIISGTLGWVYQIIGAGQETQTEFVGYYSPEGKLLIYSYCHYSNLDAKNPNLPSIGYIDSEFQKMRKKYGLSAQNESSAFQQDRKLEFRINFPL